MKNLMMTAPALLLLLLSVGASAHKADVTAQPVLKPQAGKVSELVLGPKVTAALKQFNPSFQVYELNDFIPSLVEVYVNPKKISAGSKSCSRRPIIETPMGVVADFNGDGVSDVAVLGHDGKNEYVLGVVSAGGDYKVTVIEKSEFVHPADSYFPPKDEGTEEVDEDESSIKREQGIFKSLTLVESKTDAKKDKCLPSDIQRFATDGVLVSHYLSSVNDLYQYEYGGFVEFAPPEDE